MALEPRNTHAVHNTRQIKKWQKTLEKRALKQKEKKVKNGSK
jgi:hypothetical protein